MFDKITGKDNLVKIVTVMLIASILIIVLSIFSEGDDGRKQIIDMDGGSESQLCSILSSIEGVGEVEFPKLTLGKFYSVKYIPKQSLV